MEKVQENVKVEASQKAMKAILGVSVITILLITYGVISFITNFQAL